MKIKGPPYTAEEERDFYRRNAGGPRLLFPREGRT